MYEEPNEDDLATIEAMPKAPGKTRIARLRWIVDNHTAAYVTENQICDAFTASMLVACYDKLNPKYHETFETAPFLRVVDACWKAVK